MSRIWTSSAKVARSGAATIVISSIAARLPRPLRLATSPSKSPADRSLGAIAAATRP
jgi:hypothetical protein